MLGLQTPYRPTLGEYRREKHRRDIDRSRLL